MTIVSMHTVRFYEAAARDLMEMDVYSAIWIKSIINDKLAREPEKYGKPLRKKLKGYRALKISSFRVVYVVERKTITVYVIVVGRRRDEEIYREAIRRINL